VNQAHTGPVAVIDGRSCLLLTRLLTTAVRLLGPGPELDRIRPALIAIGQAADAQRAADAAAVAAPSNTTDGWLSTREYAQARGISEQAVRKRLAKGTLVGERRGRAWVVEPEPGPFVL
jgi:hypothetical protein